MSDRYEVSRTIDSPAGRIFSVLADPRRHPEIDASGMVRGTESGPITAAGQSFTMNMYREDLDHYRTVNTVTDYVPDERIGWAPALDESFPCTLVEQLSTITTGGHTYGYRLEPDGDRTRVTQVYDWSDVRDPQFAAFCPLVTPEQLAGTLDTLASVVEGPRT